MALPWNLPCGTAHGTAMSVSWHFLRGYPTLLYLDRCQCHGSALSSGGVMVMSWWPRPWHCMGVDEESVMAAEPWQPIYG